MLEVKPAELSEHTRLQLINNIRDIDFKLANYGIMIAELEKERGKFLHELFNRSRLDAYKA